MASALRPIEFSAYYEKLDDPEKERYKTKWMCGFDTLSLEIRDYQTYQPRWRQMVTRDVMRKRPIASFIYRQVNSLDAS